MTENKPKRYSITLDKETHKDLKIKAINHEWSMKAEIKWLLANVEKFLAENDIGGVSK